MCIEKNARWMDRDGWEKNINRIKKIYILFSTFLHTHVMQGNATHRSNHDIIYSRYYYYYYCILLRRRRRLRLKFLFLLLLSYYTIKIILIIIGIRTNVISHSLFHRLCCHLLWHFRIEIRNRKALELASSSSSSS